jgi:DNA-nicking Smr family endonuclease
MLDLHGYTIHDAWNHFNTRVSDVYFQKQKTLIVITGRGVMESELPRWVSLHRHAGLCEKLSPGKFRIWIKK